MQAQLLKDGNIYEKDNFSVRYYTEEQFEKYKSSAKIVGSVKLQPENVEDEKERLIIQTPTGNIFQLKVYPCNDKEKTFGYIYLGNLDFVKIAVNNTNKKVKEIKQKNKTNKLPIIMVIVVAVIICIGIGFFLFIPKEENKKPNNISDIPIPETTIQLLSNETTEIPLYVSFNLTKNESKINLSNPENNTVDFKYEIYNNDNLLFTTENIAPGSQSTIDMSKYLQTGEYDLMFKVRCFLNGNEVNGTEEPVKVVIE